MKDFIRFTDVTKEEVFEIFALADELAEGKQHPHKSIEVVETLAKYMKVPVVNAMTDFSHPCEILADLYALSKRRRDFTKEHYDIHEAVKGKDIICTDSLSPDSLLEVQQAVILYYFSNFRI